MTSAPARHPALLSLAAAAGRLVEPHGQARGPWLDARGTES